MTDEIESLFELIEKRADTDFVRELLTFAAERLIARLVRQAIDGLEQNVVDQRYPLLKRSGHAGHVIVAQQPLA